MRKMMLIVFVFLLLAGCAGQAISRNSAEKIGREFVGERAKFSFLGKTEVLMSVITDSAKFILMLMGIFGSLLSG